MTQAIGNIVPTSDGRGRPVCQSCGSISRKAFPLDADGSIGSCTMALWDMPQGWSVAPYSAAFQHYDGTVGDMWRCPACNKRLTRGESVYRSERRLKQLGLVSA